MSWLWIAVICILLFGFLYLRSKGRTAWVGSIRFWLSRILTPEGGGQATIDRLKEAAQDERERNDEREAILEAKKVLAAERARGNRLRKEISETSERTVDEDGKPVKIRH